MAHPVTICTLGGTRKQADQVCAAFRGRRRFSPILTSVGTSASFRSIPAIAAVIMQRSRFEGPHLTGNYR